MTKRRLKNNGPTGFNKSLGKGLVNKAAENLHAAQLRNRQVLPNPNVAIQEPAKKVLDSVTHETNLEEFLVNAELAGRNFEAEKGADFKILSSKDSNVVKVEDLKTQSFEELNKKYGHLMCIPRRPKKELYTTAEELNALENQIFLEWRRSLALLAEGDGIVITPFERNLELWRQLWRVIERSDIVVQIVDARNPLLFRSPDLETYVKEVDPLKENLILVNKSDLLTPEQLREWHNFFQREKIRAVFWSALQSVNVVVNGNAAPYEVEEEHSTHTSLAGSDSSLDEPSTSFIPYVKTAEELINFFKGIGKSSRPDLDAIVVGMVGYPNVGKSSTINCVLGEKKTSVSATPGKTKHFQTLVIDAEITLCDCPGLVMPSFGFSTSEMLLNSILPVDTMRDHFSPIQVLCNRIPRRQLEDVYSVLLPKPADHEPKDRSPTAHELLTTVAFMRGYMSSSGIPDCSRAARLIMKDVVNGRLKWIAAPPGLSQDTFNDWSGHLDRLKVHDLTESGNNLLKQLDRRNLLLGARTTGAKIDNTFFSVNQGGAHIKNVAMGRNCGLTMDNGKKHGNHKKREKLRRIYAELDA